MPFVSNAGDIRQGTKVTFSHSRENGNYSKIIPNKIGKATGEVAFIFHNDETDNTQEQYVYSVRVLIDGETHVGYLLDEDIISYDNLTKESIPNYSKIEG